MEEVTFELGREKAFQEEERAEHRIGGSKHGG